LTLGGFYPAKSIAHAGGFGHGEYFDPKKDFELEREIILGKIGYFVKILSNGIILSHGRFPYSKRF
jgi:hypothetical protein